MKIIDWAKASLALLIPGLAIPSMFVRTPEIIRGITLLIP